MEYQFETGQIAVLTDLKDAPQKVNLRFPSDNTTLKEWRIDSSGHPAVEFTFSGCFRTSSMNGGEIVSWNDRYPMMCQYFADFQSRHLVSESNGKILTINGYQNFRRPMWFGYAGDGVWVFLGDTPDWEVDLSQIPNRGNSTIDPSMMLEKYSVNSLPLPQDWSTFTGPEFADMFLSELNGSE
jgi:hypothetical protein